MYDQFCEELIGLVQVHDQGELRWYAGCRFSRGWDVNTLTISQEAFAENTAAKLGVSSGTKSTLSTGSNLEEFDKNEHVRDWTFRDMVRCLMCFANQTRRGIANAVGAVARYVNKPMKVHWSTVIVTVGYFSGTSDVGVTFPRGRGLELAEFSDVDDASEATDKRSVSAGAVICTGD